ALGHRRDPPDLTTARVAIGGHEPWPPDAAAHRDDAGVVRPLQRGHAQGALADAEVARFAREPHLIGGAREALRLPLTRGQDPRLLAADVDPGSPAAARRREETGDGVDAEDVGQAIEIDVTRDHDGLV